jgi:hypothetical protein
MPLEVSGDPLWQTVTASLEVQHFSLRHVTVMQQQATQCVMDALHAVPRLPSLSAGISSEAAAASGAPCQLL